MKLGKAFNSGDFAIGWFKIYLFDNWGFGIRTEEVSVRIKFVRYQRESISKHFRYRDSSDSHSRFNWQGNERGFFPSLLSPLMRKTNKKFMTASRKNLKHFFLLIRRKHISNFTSAVKLLGKMMKCVSCYHLLCTFPFVNFINIFHKHARNFCTKFLAPKFQTQKPTL